MKKIILLSLIACTCVFAKYNKVDSFCEDVGIFLVRELQDCVININDIEDIEYECTNGQFYIDRNTATHAIIVRRDTAEIDMYFLPNKEICVIKYYDELGVLVRSGKTDMSAKHRFDVYNEFKKHFVK